MRGAWCVVRDERPSRTTRHAPRGGLARWLAAGLALLATGATATNLPPATVSFLDGSFLRGEIGSLNSDVLRWLHPNARAPIEFSTTNLNLIRLPARSTSLPTNAGPVCRVVLASGDEFEGQLLSLDADSFEIETWFAGRLRGQRAGLQSLAFYGSSQTALYDGPRAADEWNISTGAATVNRVGVNIFGGLGNALIRPAAPAPIPAPAAVPQFRLVEPAKPVERRAFTVEELARLSEDAERSATVAVFLKTDLVKEALKAGQTSQAALERWFADFKDPNDWAKDEAKAARFKVMLRAEVDVLVRRLQGRAAPFVEPGQPAPQPLPAPAVPLNQVAPPRAPAVDPVAQAVRVEAERAVGKAAADVLAQARERALGALRLNNPNLILPPGAEGALAGRAAVPGAQNPNAAWTFRDGAYYSTGVGTLGRECHLPTKARIEFDLAWKGQPYFRFSFFTRSTEHYDYSDGWQFYISSSGYIYSMRRSGMGASSSSGARVPQMLAKNTVRFTFLVNTEAETVTLLADGEKVHEWKSLGSPGPGTGIVFYNYNANSRVRVSDIRVAPWDGRERDAVQPGAPGDDPDKLVELPPADSAVVEFVNRDRASGTLHGIRDGKLAFNPAGTKLEIPLARAALIAFPVGDAPALPKVEGVQVTLHRNERLTLALEQWEAEEIIAVSPVFGRLKLKPESVRALRFNPSATRGPVDEWSGP